MNPIVRPFAAALAAGLTLILPALCWASSVMLGAMPWDQPLNLIVAYLTGPATYTLVKLAFIAATIYLITGDSNRGVRQLAGAGLGGALALEAVRLMNWLFP